MPSPALEPRGRIDEPRFGLSFALLVAILLHMVLLLTVWAFPGVFRSPTLLWVEKDEKPPPLKFTFMDLLDDSVVKDNPDAALLSDAAREEAGETPEVTTPEGKQPPSKGNTRERIDGGSTPEPLPDPAREAARMKLPRPAAPTPAAQPPPHPPAQAAAAPAPEREPQPSQQTGPTPADTPEEARRGRPAPPGPGSGGVRDGGDTGANQRRQDPRQRRFAKALEDMTAPLPADMQALTPPGAESASRPTPGQSTIWQFDNDNPSYPVKIGHLSFDSKGADFGPWLREFHRRVLNEWHRNLEAWSLDVWRNISASRFIPDQEKRMRHAYRMSRVRGVTGIDFVVTREGSVVSMQIVHRSGNEGLDRSVQRTLRNVILPPLPDDYPDETLPIRAGFYYNVEPAE
ncbi:MAG: energy transducer TonB [Rhodospirillales bacterium]